MHYIPYTDQSNVASYATEMLSMPRIQYRREKNKKKREQNNSHSIDITLGVIYKAEISVSKRDPDSSVPPQKAYRFTGFVVIYTLNVSPSRGWCRLHHSLANVARLIFLDLLKNTNTYLELKRGKKTAWGTIHNIEYETKYATGEIT